MSLPLLDRVTEQNPFFRITEGPLVREEPPAHGLIPTRALLAGEQYRFHFDMTKCIGCKCCEVACNEQNGNPATVNWRRVGELEGGVYPATKRFYLSMGCNHCIEPACLKGCPVDAYNKDSLTGLVLHNADTCIGCGYCTWNCPYGVPQFNEDRGVVGKCDMCHERLADGREPACVNACPQHAIEIEIVNMDEWRLNHSTGNAPGMPDVRQTQSTTRITLPDKFPADLQKANIYRTKPEHAHMPLVFMLVLTQLAVGAFATLALSGRPSGALALASFVVAMAALGASTLHLGRPIHAYRALKMWRRSWLSREVLLFSLFAAAASLFVASVFTPFDSLRNVLAGVTAVLGIAGITASAFIYLVPARPAWNRIHTLLDFYLTAAQLGPLFACAFGVAVPTSVIWCAALFQLGNRLTGFSRLHASPEFEKKEAARLLTADLKYIWASQLGLLILGGILLPAMRLSAAAFAVSLCGELAARYLFFVSVVPRNMALTFFDRKAA